MASFAVEGLFNKKRNALFSFIRHRFFVMLKNSMLRNQTPEGIKRIEISPDSNLRELYEYIYKTFKLNDYGFSLFKDRNLSKELIQSRTNTIYNSQIKHGDMLLFKQMAGPSRRASTAAVDNNQVHILNSQAASTSLTNWPEEENASKGVDDILFKLDGRIQRSRSEFCQHSYNGDCIHCSALEPYDPKYLEEAGINHMSFHSYLRKLMSGVDQEKALEDINYKIKSSRRDHSPWPKAICTKCQPSAITLDKQPYRHVDNVMFENSMVVQRFIDYWRSTGHQRMGYLYGVYKPNRDVPLGIRAHVVAIYEPPQQNDEDKFQLLPDPFEKEVDELAEALGLQKIGWIFTDIVNDDRTSGTVKHIRGADTHLLSAQECILAGRLQNQHPNPCEYSSNGFFGSKFVTVCVTGDKNKSIHMEGYAVSGQGMSLVRDGCLVPIEDAPELGYIRESTDKHLIPDVFYKVKDQHGNEVSHLASQLPIEYLLGDVPASTPVSPSSTFTVSDKVRPFPIENRFLKGEFQDFNVLAEYLSKWGPGEFLEAVTDFHLLLYLYKMQILPMKQYLGTLLEAVRDRNKELAYEFKNGREWKVLENLIALSSAVNAANAYHPGEENPNTWVCQHCTFVNYSKASNCEICGI